MIMIPCAASPTKAFHVHASQNFEQTVQPSAIITTSERIPGSFEGIRCSLDLVNLDFGVWKSRRKGKQVSRILNFAIDADWLAL